VRFKTEFHHRLFKRLQDGEGHPTP
jgi:hypothetical protein